MNAVYQPVKIVWRSVDEVLPALDDSVLIFAPESDSQPVSIGWYEPLLEEWYTVDGATSAPVTHWAPLPEPPIYEKE